MPLTLTNRLLRLSTLIVLLSVLGMSLAFFIGEHSDAAPQLAVVAHDDEDNYTLYLTDSRRSISTRLAHYDAMISQPQWSPDGEEMIYRVYHDDGHRLYVYNLTSGKTSLSWADGNTYTGLPAWSPDGEEIAFVSNNQGGFSLLYVLNLESREFRQISPYTVNSETPIWTANGEQLQYTAWRSNRDVMISVNADGSDPQILFPEYFSGVMSVAWSPSREQLAFPQTQTNGILQRSDLFVLDVSESVNFGDAHLVAEHAGVNAFPAWSADGEQIAYVSARDVDTELYRVDLGDQSTTRLTDFPANTVPTEPAWSSDGRYIAFFAVVNAQRGSIYVMDAEGNGLHRLILPLAPVTMAWRP